MNAFEQYIVNIEKKSRKPYLRNMNHADSIRFIRNMRYNRRDFIDSLNFNPLLTLLGVSEYLKEYRKQKSLGNPAYDTLVLPLP